MSIINLTPHVININNIAIQPSGQIARVASTSKVVDVIDIDGQSVEVVETVFGEVDYGGPCWRQPGTYYLVSALVRLAAKGRTDLLSPGEQTRDSSGKVTGCKNLTR